MRSQFDHKTHPYFPGVQVGGNALLEAARKPEALLGVLSVLQRLEPDPFNEYVTRFYTQGYEKFGDNWGYADLLTVLWVAAGWIQPETYAEIGVFRGRSAAIVAARCPNVRVYGFDLWDGEVYEGVRNPGPEVAEANLKRVGHSGEAMFVRGDSKKTFPTFRYQDTFDLLLVDGDHSVVGANADLANAVNRVTLGGALVFDDVGQLVAPWMPAIWDKLVGKNPRYTSAIHAETGAGVAVGVRRV